MNTSNMETVYSRKHFLLETLRQCFRLLVRNIDLKDTEPNQEEAEGFSDSLAIAPDFSPALLRQEALRLGLDPDFVGWEQLLQAVCKAMEEQRQTRGNEGSNPF